MVLTANCSCMAGLGSACSHVAALLFKLETAVHLELHKPEAPTSQLCAWKKSKRNVIPAPVKCINFKRIKTHQLPAEQNEVPISSVTQHYSFRDPCSGLYGLNPDDIINLHKVKSNAAFFTSIDINDYHQTEELIDTSETDTASETDQNCLPDTLTSLYDPSAINLAEESLSQLCDSRYAEYKKTYSQRDYNNLTEITIKQSLNKAWMFHRAGRITASIAQQAFRMKKELSESLLKIVMQYGDFVDNKYTRYGKDMEPKARVFYYNKNKDYHQNFKVEETGFHVNAEYPYLGASPDGLIYCTCHEAKVLEIKCPFKYQNGLINWETDRQFCIDQNVCIKENHPYYFQMQLQMLLTGCKYADLLIYSPVENGSSSLIITVHLNLELMNDFKSKTLNILKSFYFQKLLHGAEMWLLKMIERFTVFVRDLALET